jgi:hypothetical protein
MQVAPDLNRYRRIWSRIAQHRDQLASAAVSVDGAARELRNGGWAPYRRSRG